MSMNQSDTSDQAVNRDFAGRRLAFACDNCTCQWAIDAYDDAITRAEMVPDDLGLTPIGDRTPPAENPGVTQP